MGKYGNAFKRAFKAAAIAAGPGGYEVAGNQIQCFHCGNYEFEEGRAQLNTAGMSFFKLD